jgi:hypothetical protein
MRIMIVEKMNSRKPPIQNLFGVGQKVWKRLPHMRPQFQENAIPRINSNHPDPGMLEIKNDYDCEAHHNRETEYVNPVTRLARRHEATGKD